MRKREILKILAWSAYFSAIVYLIILHPQYVNHFHDPLSEVQKIIVFIFMIFIFFITGVILKKFRLIRKYFLF
mgnify:CR=1 FL=1